MLHFCWRGPSRLIRHIVIATSIVITIVLILHVSRSASQVTPSRPLDNPWHNVKSAVSTHEVTIVVVALSTENTSWISTEFSFWKRRIYVVDDKHAQLTVPVNKGREAMAYLTHIIDNYDTLTPVTIFRHSARYQWHTDDPLYDGQRALQRLQIPYIVSQGYVSLRCSWMLGCPAEIRPFIDASQHFFGESPLDGAGPYYGEAFEQLFPGKPVPQVVGAPCCAEFAVTAGKIRERPRSDYVRYREWLLTTKLHDNISGRILEYAWHIIFGRPDVNCPRADTCYCGLYGLCDLKCEDVGICQSQYKLPPWSNIPKGWPEVDWDGNARNVSIM